MFEFECKSLGVDCDFSTTGETKDEVRQATFAHAGEAHQDLMAAMSPEEAAEFENSVEGAIKLI